MMTDKSIKILINKLNANNLQGLIHLRPLTDKVVFAKVWTVRPKPTDNVSLKVGPYDFYFIKNEEGIYVAAIFDMRQDLHWYVLPKHRGKGHLTCKE